MRDDFKEFLALLDRHPVVCAAWVSPHELRVVFAEATVATIRIKAAHSSQMESVHLERASTKSLIEVTGAVHVAEGIMLLTASNQPGIFASPQNCMRLKKSAVNKGEINEISSIKELASKPSGNLAVNAPRDIVALWWPHEDSDIKLAGSVLLQSCRSHSSLIGGAHIANCTLVPQVAFAPSIGDVASHILALCFSSVDALKVSQLKLLCTHRFFFYVCIFMCPQVSPVAVTLLTVCQFYAILSRDASPMLPSVTLQAYICPPFIGTPPNGPKAPVLKMEKVVLLPEPLAFAQFSPDDIRLLYACVDGSLIIDYISSSNKSALEWRNPVIIDEPSTAAWHPSGILVAVGSRKVCLVLVFPS